MRKQAKRVLSWVLAISLLTTCAISGLVLPASASAVKFTETFDGETTLAATLWEGKGTLTTDPTNSNNKVLYFASDVSNKYNKTSFGLEPNKYYCLSVDFYGAKIKIDSYDGAKVYGDAGLADGDKWTEAGNTWKTVKYLLRTASESVNQNWAFNVDAKAGSYMDNIVVTEVDFGDNMILGGDLEYGRTTVWSNTDRVAPGVGKDGSYGIKAESNASLLVPDVYYKHAFNGLLEPNTTYIFSFDYKHEGVGFPQLYVIKSADGGTVMKTTNFDAGDYEWKKATFEFTTGASVETHAGWEWQVRQVQYADQAGTGASYFDNFSLVKKPAGATAIELDKDAATLTEGEELTLNVTAKPDGAPLPALTWASDNEAVATVANGKVTAVAEGTAKITVTAGELSDSCTITVEKSDGNLLVNGDFEAGVTGWENNGYIVAGGGRDGSAGIKIETTVNEGESAKQPGVYYLEAFNGALKPNTAYVFSFDYKHEGKGWPQLNIVRGGTDWTGWANTNLSSNVDWTTHTIEFKTGDAANMNANKGWEWKARVVHYANAANYGSAVTQFDNFKLIEKPSAASGIVLDKSEASVECGKEITLNVTATPVGAPMPAVTWKSSDESVATVADGKVKGIAEGTATITATADGLDPVTCTVTVVAAQLLENGDFEAGVTGWENNGHIVAGGGRDGSTGLKFETTVNEGDSSKVPGTYYKGSFNGILKPYTTYIFSFDYKHEGKGFPQIDVVNGGTDWTGWKDTDLPANKDWNTYTIEFTTGAADKMNVKTGWEWQPRVVHYANAANYGSAVTQFDNFKLVEKPKTAQPNSITMNKTTASLVVGGNTKLSVTADPVDADLTELTWKSSDDTVATVADGVVTAVKAGTATITATIGTLSVTCEVTVKEPVSDGNLLTNGDFEQGGLSWGTSSAATFNEGDGKDGSIGLKISTSVAEGGGSVYPGVYYKGEFIKKLKPNTKYIFSFDYKHEGKGFGRVNVTKKISDWQNWSTTPNLTATEWTKYTVEFTTGEAENMEESTGWEWVPEHVQYSSTPGTGAVYFDNFRLEEKVVVAATAITLDKTTATLNPGKTTALTVTAAPENAEKPTVVWTSSNESVATVNKGVVTAVAEGTAIITATANGTLTATCVVTVVPHDGNLIENGDFANGSDSWGRDQAQKDRIEADAGKEGAGLKLHTVVNESTTGHQTPGVYYMEPLIELLEPDTIYEFSFDYKHEGKGFGQIIFNISPGKLPNGSEFKNTSLKSGNVDWTTMKYTITTPSALPTANSTWEWQMRQVQYYDQGQGEGTSWYDNFKLVKVGKVVHADEIKLTPETLEVLPFDSSALAVGTVPAGASEGVLTWVSSDPTVIEVDQKGNVKALKGEGEATITVTNDKGKTATAKVVISEYANVLKNGNFEQGPSVNWGGIANVKPGIGKDGSYGVELTHEGTSGWTSYYYKGSFVGLIQPATTYIFSVDYYAPSNTSEIRFWSYDLGFSTSSHTAGKNEWKTYTKIFTTPTDMDLRTGWDLSLVCSSTGNPPAVVDNLSIKKYSTGVKADSIVLNLQKMTLIPGRTGALTAHATPVEADLNDMTWVSSDENVATVEYGVVTGVGKGTAVITGTTKNGKSASCTVTVSGNDVLVLNGSFDTDDDVWKLEDGAAIVEGEGRVNSKAGKLVKNAVIKQTFKGLKAETQYQLFIRYRTASGKASVKLTNGDTELVNQETGTNSLWTSLVFDFTTGATVEEDTVLTLTGLGNGPIYVDNVIVAVKASLIDFTANDIVWVGGGHQVKPGTELTFAVTVTNIGEDPVPADAVVVVDLCKNGEVFQTLEYLCTEAITKGTSVIVMADTPWVAEKGDWVISARVNPTLSILELDDTNNTDQVNLRVNENILEAPKEAADMDMTELTFSDEFDSYDSIDMYATGKDGYKWYVTRSWGAGTVQPDSYTVKDGIISLHDQKPVFNITMGTVDAVTGVGWDYQYGYLETRLRIVYPDRHEYAEGMSGGIPAIWSFPTDKWLERPGKNRQWVEMDWLEYWGRDTQRWPQYPDGYYTVTLHDQRQTEDGKQETWKVNSNSYQNGLGDGEWHVMGWLWAYNGVIAYIDGEEVFRITYSEDGTPSCKVRTNAGDMFNDIGAFSYMNQQELCLYIAGAYDKPLELDYVRIWQGGNAEVEPPKTEEEEDDSEIVVDIPAEEFYYNYCTDDWGDPIVKVTEENYETVLAGGEFWDYLTKERQDEINKLLAENGQPSFEELLADALAIANPETGATTVLPMVLVALLPMCVAVLWFTRKRRHCAK